MAAQKKKVTEMQRRASQGRRPQNGKSRNRRPQKRKQSGNFFLDNTKNFSIALTVLIGLGFLFVIITMVLTLSYDKVYEGIYLNEVSVSHMSKEELEEYINEKYSKPLNNITLDINMGEMHWKLNASDLNIKFNNEHIVDAIYDYGHSGNIFERLSDINEIKSENKNIDVWTAESNTGELVTYNETVVDELAAKIVSEAAIASTAHQVDTDSDPEKVFIVAGNVGYSFDKAKVKTAILDEINKFESASLDISKVANITYPDKLNVDEYCNKINRSPVDAKYTTSNDGKTLEKVAGKDGFSVDKSTLEDIAGKLLDNPGKSFEVEVKRISPAVNIDDLETMDFSDVLGSYSTKFSTSSSYANRNVNIQLATEDYLDGYIILPGEEFSFNTIIGDTTEAKGYKKAGGYAGGKVVQTPGGGICQVSTTLYNAVIRSHNLLVTERSNHSYTVDYVPKGLDCMINYGTNDFKFKNNTSNPIKLVGIYTKGKVEYKILGINKYKNITYDFDTPVQVSTVKYETRETTDSKAVQSGKNGGVYTVKRYIVQDGVRTEDKTFKYTRSSYKAMHAYKLKTVARPSDNPSASPSSPAVTPGPVIDP